MTSCGVNLFSRAASIGASLICAKNVVCRGEKKNQTLVQYLTLIYKEFFIIFALLLIVF